MDGHAERKEEIADRVANGNNASAGCRCRVRSVCIYRFRIVGSDGGGGVVVVVVPPDHNPLIKEQAPRATAAAASSSTPPPPTGPSLTLTLAVA